MVPAKEVIVGIDMGGTSLRALVVNAQNEILAIEKTPTNVAQKPEGLIRDLAVMVEDVVASAGLRKSQLRAVSIGAPGAVDPEHGVVYHAPNLGWDAVPLGAKLESCCASPSSWRTTSTWAWPANTLWGQGRGRRNWWASLWGRESAAASFPAASFIWGCGARRRRWAT